MTSATLASCNCVRRHNQFKFHAPDAFHGRSRNGSESRDQEGPGKLSRQPRRRMRRDVGRSHSVDLAFAFPATRGQRTCRYEFRPAGHRSNRPAPLASKRLNIVASPQQK
eukprot:767937-Hanusia_phi.AAC.5